MNDSQMVFAFNRIIRCVDLSHPMHANGRSHSSVEISGLIVLLLIQPIDFRNSPHINVHIQSLLIRHNFS